MDLWQLSVVHKILTFIIKNIIKIIEEQSKIEFVCGLLHGEIVFQEYYKWSELRKIELYSSVVSLLNSPTQSLIDAAEGD